MFAVMNPRSEAAEAFSMTAMRARPHPFSVI